MFESEWHNNTLYNHIVSDAPIKEVYFESDFTHPFTATVCGPSMSGKTFFISKLISLSRNDKVSPIVPLPQKIVYVYSEWQPLFDEMTKDKSPVIVSFRKKSTLIIRF